MEKIRIGLLLLCTLCNLQVGAQHIYTLDECVNWAMENNVKMKNSRLDLHISEHTKKEVFTNFFPQLSAGGMGFSSNNDLLKKNIDLTPVGSMIGSLGLDPVALGIPSSLPVGLVKNGMVGYASVIQPVFMGGQIVNGNRLAKIGKDVSELKIRLSEKDVKLKTEQYYYQIVTLKEKEKTIRQAENQLVSIYKDVKKAVEAGVAVPNDLLRVELEQQKVATGRLQVENGIRVSKLLLKYHIGIPDENFDVETLDELTDESPIEYYISPVDALSMRPESELLDKGVEAAKLERKIAVGKNLPQVGIGAGWTYHNILDENTDAGVIFAKVSVPISGWWSGSHSIKKAKLKEQKAYNERIDNRNLMMIEMEAKWSALTEAYERVLLARKTIDSSEENLRMNKEYYIAGTISLSDLLDARTLFQQSRDGYVEACNNYQMKKIEYLQATGRE